MARVGLIAAGGIVVAFGFGVLVGQRVIAPRAGYGPAAAVTGPARPDGDGSGARPAPAAPGEGFVGVVYAPQAVDLAASVEARLEAVPVQLGQRLAKDATVATLDAESIRRELAAATAAVRAAQAEVSAARVELSEAKAKAARVARLGDAVAPEEVEGAQYQERLAAARVEAARARAAEAMATVEKLRALLENTAIVAPFDGVVAARYQEPGAIVGPAKPIIRLISAEDRWVRFAVPETDTAAVAPKGCVEVALDAAGTRLSGVIEMVAPQIDGASRMLVVEARLVASADELARLHVGGAARVRATPCGKAPTP